MINIHDLTTKKQLLKGTSGEGTSEIIYEEKYQGVGQAVDITTSSTLHTLPDLTERQPQVAYSRESDIIEEDLKPNTETTLHLDTPAPSLRAILERQVAISEKQERISQSCVEALEQNEVMFTEMSTLLKEETVSHNKVAKSK